MILVVGATGTLGSEIVRLLAAAGIEVRALVRATSAVEKVDELRSLGVEIATGDLMDPESLVAACAGADTVVSTATAILSQKDGDSIERVDGDGQLRLVTTAESEGVRRFAFVSFPKLEPSFPVQDAKRAAEGALEASSMEHTILHASHFMEVWLSPMMGFDAANGTARIYGDGSARLSWISYRDVAREVVRIVTAAPAPTGTLDVGGPEALSALDVVHIFEDETGRTFRVEHVLDDALEAQYAAATTSLERSFAGLMLGTAHATPVSPAEVGKLLSVRDFARGQR